MNSLLTCNSSPRINELTVKRTNDSTKAEGRDTPIRITYGLATSDRSDKNTCNVKINASVDGEGSPINITLEVEAVFNINGDVTEEELDKAGASIAGPIVFTLVQEQIADITRKMGLPPLNLPYPDFTKAPKESTENDTVD